MLNCKKSSIAFTTAICAASFGLFGCGGDSNGTGPEPKGDVCSVTKTATTVTYKSEVEGVSQTVVYVFGADGNMVSQVTSSDYSAMGDDITAKSVCEASALAEGFEAKYENGICTVTQTMGLAGTLDEIYQSVSIVCDAANEAASSSSEINNPFAKSSSSSGGTKTVVDDLAALAVIKCNAASVGTRVMVKSENNDYLCVSYEESGMTNRFWAPTIDDIDNAPKCTEQLILSGDNATYYSESDKTIYSCVMDIIDPYDFSKSEYIWKSYGKYEPESSNGGHIESSDSTPKSSASASGKKVTFVDGIIWQPSYDVRANTGFFKTSEETFLSECSAEDENCGGYWFKYLDNVDGGSSMAKGTFTTASLKLNFDLVYKNWELVSDGLYSYYAPDPYPYAGFGFNWANDKAPVDISNLGNGTTQGICLTYSSTELVKIVLVSNSTSLDAAHYKYTLSNTDGASKTLNIPFSSFKQPTWDHISVSLSTAIKNSESLQFQYTNDESGVTSYCETYSECLSAASYWGSSSITIYEIGEYGSCGKGTSTL